MVFIQKVKERALKIIGFIQYFYYSLFIKNYYPLILHSEKRDTEKNLYLIVYYKVCNTGLNEISIKSLLKNPNLISCFNPEEALKIGFMAFEQFSLENTAAEIRSKFNHIKNVMLNSTCDISQTLTETVSNKPIEVLSDTKESIRINKNKYPCRLVGVKHKNFRKDTRIIFTVFGKRDGFSLQLTELINNKALLNKFHPTEAVKFGFIYLGEASLI